MYPEGLFGLDWFRVLLAPIAIFCIAFFSLYLREEGIKVSKTVLLLLSVGLVAILGAKLFSLHVRGWQLYQPIATELRGGLRYPGALLAMILLGPALKRWILPGLPLLRFLDVLSITICFGALVRISCFLNGCCTGMQCTEGYCLSFPPGSQVWYLQFKQGLLEHASHPSHRVLPLHLLFMLSSFAVGILLIWIDKRRSFDGQIALLFLVLHEGGKGLLESFREPYLPQLQVSSLVMSGSALLVLLLIWRLRARQQS